MAGSGAGEAAVGALDVPPVQTSTRPVFIHRQLFGEDKVFFERFQRVVIELEAAV